MRYSSKNNKQILLHIAVVTCMLVFSTPDNTFAGEKQKSGKGKKFENIITAIVAPPVVGNGTIAGEPTEIIAVLNAPGALDSQALNPVNFGHQIPAGGRMEVEIGGTFQRNGVDNTKEFVPVNSNAFFVLVTGLPQMPVTAPA